jgi:hypothetical protein
MHELQNDDALRRQMAASAYRACRERWSESVVIDRLEGLVSAGLDARRNASPPAATVA